jgi:glycosyltransferase involved in cell wall biosynthesis
MAAMRIAVVTHNIVRGDGQGRANLEIVRYARQQGAKLTLFSDRVDEEILQDGVEWVKIQPKIRNNWLIHGMEFQWRANALINQRRTEFDIIHGYGGCLTAPHTINTSQFVHSAWLKNAMHPSRTTSGFYALYQRTYSRYNAAMERKAYHNAKFVVPASNTVRRELHEEIGIAESKMRVILNGAEPSEFHPGTEDRAALGLPVGGPLALFAGDLRTGRKNLDSVLKALVEVPDLNLAIVGKKAESPFPALAEQLGVANRAHFLDFRRDISSIMRACDFFVFPSRYEACALVLVEALSSGLPIITAETTGGAEVVTLETGIRLKDTEDVAALTAAMRELTASPERCKQLSVAAYAASASYTWEKIASAYYTLYQELAS